VRADCGFRPVAVIRVVLDRSQCMIDRAALIGPAAHQREIRFFDRRAGKRVGQGSCSARVEREDEGAGGTLVQPVHRIHVLAELIAEQLHCKAGFARVNGRAVYEQAGGLVDDHDPVVAMEDRQRPGVHAAPGEEFDGDTTCLRSG
jgi:hypothetical protein